MKTDKEIVAAIRAASAQLKRFYTSGVDVPASSKTTRALDAIADALEANPPLAEGEGRLIEQATIWVLLPIGLEHSDFTMLPDGDCDVTVTIRKRER